MKLRRTQALPANTLSEDKIMYNLLLPGWVIPTIVIGVIVLLVIIVVACLIGTYNKFVKIRNSCEEAWATIDVYLKKRYDLIPNLVETVKGYASHEKETLERVIAARNAAMTATDTRGKIEAENALTGTLKTLFALSEAYPQLQANTNFLDLQNQLKQIEAELANARKYYNATVKRINTKMQTFPSNIVAGAMHLEKFEYYEIEDEARQNVKVKF